MRQKPLLEKLEYNEEYYSNNSGSVRHRSDGAVDRISHMCVAVVVRYGLEHQASIPSVLRP